MQNYKVNVDVATEARIDSRSIANIMVDEKYRLLGDQDRYIHDGVIYENDYRFDNDEVVREATEEEIKLYEALRIVERHFRNK